MKSARFSGIRPHSFRSRTSDIFKAHQNRTLPAINIESSMTPADCGTCRSASGPLLLSPTCGGHGSNRGISCRPLRSRTTVEIDRRSNTAIGSNRIALFLSAAFGNVQFALVPPTISSYSGTFPHSHSIILIHPNILICRHKPFKPAPKHRSADPSEILRY
jgi:hypothetical protein